MVMGSKNSEIHTWYRFFREIAGYYEDFYPIKMGGKNIVCEGDGMFVIGKRKCGVGRWHSQEHIYVVTERNSRKIRRILVNDKSAEVLNVFAKHILPGTIMMTDEGGGEIHGLI